MCITSSVPKCRDTRIEVCTVFSSLVCTVVAEMSTPASVAQRNTHLKNLTVESFCVRKQD